MAIPFSKKCEILADLWMNYRSDEGLEDFIEYNDLGLPMAYLEHTELMRVSDIGKQYIEETYDLFCKSLDLDSEKEYNSLNEMLGEADQE